VKRAPTVPRRRIEGTGMNGAYANLGIVEVIVF
jgi:hypothetical protein